MDKMREQSIKFGTTVHTETISRVDFTQRPFKVWREDYDEETDAVYAHSIIIATGATAKRVITTHPSITHHFIKIIHFF